MVSRTIRIGDLVKIKLDCGIAFDWQDVVTGDRGYHLRDSVTHALMMHGTGDFRTDDVCLVIGIERRWYIEVLTPRSQIGTIHENKLEVVSEAG